LDAKRGQEERKAFETLEASQDMNQRTPQL